MYLMRHDEAVVADAQMSAKQRAVLSDSLLAVATIAVDVEFAKASLAIAALTRSAEGCHALAHVIFEQFKFCHICIVFALQRYDYQGK